MRLAARRWAVSTFDLGAAGSAGHHSQGGRGHGRRGDEEQRVAGGQEQSRRRWWSLACASSAALGPRLPCPAHPAFARCVIGTTTGAAAFSAPRPAVAPCRSGPCCPRLNEQADFIPPTAPARPAAPARCALRPSHTPMPAQQRHCPAARCPPAAPARLRPGKPPRRDLAVDGLRPCSAAGVWGGTTPLGARGRALAQGPTSAGSTCTRHSSGAGRASRRMGADQGPRLGLTLQRSQ